MKLWQLTRPFPPQKILKTGYGDITYLKWLRLERKRLQNAGIKCHIHPEERNGKGTYVSLFRQPWKLKEGTSPPDEVLDVAKPKSASVGAVKKGKEKK